MSAFRVCVSLRSKGNEILELERPPVNKRKPLCLMDNQVISTTLIELYLYNGFSTDNLSSINYV